MPHINTSNKLTCIEGFCGAGGMSLGLKQAGFDVRLAFDINENAVETYNKNIGNHCEKLDASIVSGKFLLEKAGIKTRLDLFSGGPPCQGFSKQRRGAHLLDDDRNKLVLEYSRLVNELKPRAFLFENVEIFGQKRGKDLIDEIKIKLFDYNIYTYFICSSDFGVAQKRGRFLMIGIDKSEGKIVPKLLKSDKTLTIRDVIGQLPPPPEDYKEHPDIPNHIKCKITKINEERFSHVPPGGGWKDIPYDLRLKCHQKVDTASGGWPDVYGRLEWDKQCPTITAGFDSFTRGRYGHPSQNRAITLREGAMLQGFPVNYRFYGNRDAIRLQIGNAVPPPVSYAAGTAIINCLDTKQDKNHFNFQNPMELDKDGQFSLAI
ncbi:DNA cytosine methyltransferase [Klebsiella pneumoniae]|jgi:DNA (cytosine-5)-methyltransferase 1|uniref:DNA cytosine methyltransferase n=1 Tax=Klebsiella TaxID=570 RepID=UPI0015E5632E|nr:MULTISPECIES: DNA cytosine methyltransferase [Klebsiella]HCO0795970.1 DNA cytosine methyltransferase [Escherichia coli]MCL3214191.1 DNA cytosine methyltransferase [Klebsiella pneumoniae]MCZ3472492.1 DNA cytosine methyltransferase [Klebsiella pneumoniae]MEA4778754.1 DNA cytosine methyltransferase [Klebsiella pneumoniae]QLP45216.1 DNA cytosine methyltransferase [Klebsiella grimontii]